VTVLDLEQRGQRKFVAGEDPAWKQTAREVRCFPNNLGRQVSGLSGSQDSLAHLPVCKRNRELYKRLGVYPSLEVVDPSLKSTPQGWV
jgi:hypothetical protein